MIKKKKHQNLKMHKSLFVLTAVLLVFQLVGSVAKLASYFQKIASFDVTNCFYFQPRDKMLQ